MATGTSVAVSKQVLKLQAVLTSENNVDDIKDLPAIAGAIDVLIDSIVPRLTLTILLYKTMIMSLKKDWSGYIFRLGQWFKPGKEKARKQNMDADELIKRSIEEWKRRPVYDELTEEIIDNIPDNDLLQLVFDDLLAKLPEDYRKEYETVQSFTRPQQVIYVIWWLEAEVNNGGFNQFYYNSSRQFADMVPEALLAVGAHRLAELTEKANNIYRERYEAITHYQDGTMEGFSKSYKDNSLNESDMKFYELTGSEALFDLQITYIRKNKNSFTGR